MAVTDADFGELQKQVQALSAEVALLKRSSSWWYQFSSTALPIVITLLITVLGAVALQNSRFESLDSRFESLESRIAAVEADGKQLLSTQAALQKDVTLLRQDITAFKQGVEALGQGMGALRVEVRDLKNLLVTSGRRGREAPRVR